MARYSSSSSTATRSSKSSRDSTFSNSSKYTYHTNNTSCSDTTPGQKNHKTVPAQGRSSTRRSDNFVDEGLPRSSVETYASSVASRNDLHDESDKSFPRERMHCFAPDAIPTTPAEFAELFPSTRRLMIQHEDSATDGNTNLRVDTEVTTAKGRKRKMTLFHLRMKDLAEREFSLRRYCRDSGREIVSSKRRYVKPLPAQLKGGKSSAVQVLTSQAEHSPKKPVPRRQDSGYASESDEEDFEENLKVFTALSNVKATIPTNAIRLEFSNYAQVIIEPRQASGDRKEYAFEYWGESYCWKRKIVRDEGEIISTYDLVNTLTGKKMASMMPDAVSKEEAQFEAKQGAWIPASSMRLLQKDVSDDLADVIVATGLISLTDDCLHRQYRQELRRK